MMTTLPKNLIIILLIHYIKMFRSIVDVSFEPIEHFFWDRKKRLFAVDSIEASFSPEQQQNQRSAGVKLIPAYLEKKEEPLERTMDSSMIYRTPA
ncbi:hypothetical protein [Paenibacillus spongiae]|uniref:Uncharacterized protein n=1 Tax=Paenibacillus spongiae TaxID=2909671 RepID=A0ABY5S356_9BACL|nr:hypothetical protein [Paenibacillus spongiae]UVI28322.1 hypothetical protein L1F29_23110 [Paenibacillus spongiae]